MIGYQGFRRLGMAAGVMFIVLLPPLVFSPRLHAQVIAPHLTADEVNGGIRLHWTRPAAGGRWAILRSYDEFGLVEDTLAYTSDTTWFDPEGLNYPGDRAFYRIVPWEPDPLPNLNIPIESFDGLTLNLQPFDPAYDLDPQWELADSNSFGEEGQHLLLGGDTWKTEFLETPRQLNSGTIWAIDAMSDTTSRLQMIGLGDGENELWYVLWGLWAPNSDSLIWTYQGFFPEEEWFSFNLPVGEDWHGRFGDYPMIDRVYYVNDSSSPQNLGNLRLDNLRDATGAQPGQPAVDFRWQWMDYPDPDSVAVQFHNWSLDIHSDSLRFCWSFGDGTTSTEEHPYHVYPIGGEWPVTLRVNDGWNYWDFHTQWLSDGPITQPRGDFTITCVGDVILARGIITRIDQLGQDAMFANVQGILNQTDLRMCNLECPLTTSNTGHPTKGVLFRARPQDAPIISNAGFNFVSQANNHSVDYMESGMLETLGILDDIRVAWTGAGMNDVMARQPSFLNYNRMTFGVIATCNRDGHYNNAQPFLDAARDRFGFALWNRTGIENTMAAVRDSVDLLMYQTHCGSEYSFFPRDGDTIQEGTDEVGVDDPYVIFSLVPDSGEVALRHYAIDMGADAVICHHPHVIQGVEVYNGRFIAHSLGDFLFDLSYNECLPSMIAQLHVNTAGDIDAVKILPAWVRDYLPVIPTGNLAKAVLDYLTHYSRLLDTHLTRPPDGAIADVQFDTLYSRDEATGGRIVPLDPAGPDFVRTSPQFLNWEGYVTRVQVANAPPGTRIRYGRDILLWGDMEDEGADPWILNSNYEHWDTEVAHDGVRSILISLPEGTWSNFLSDFTYRVKLQSYRPHSFSGYMKTHTVSDATYQIRFHYSRDSNPLSTTEIGLQGTNDWTQLYYDFDTIQTDWNFLNVRCNQNPPGNQDGDSWFDEVAFIEWQDWHNVDDDGAVEVPYPSGYRFAQVEIPEDVAPPNGQITLYYQREWPSMYPPPANLGDDLVEQAAR